MQHREQVSYDISTDNFVTLPTSKIQLLCTNEVFESTSNSEYTRQPLLVHLTECFNGIYN